MKSITISAPDEHFDACVDAICDGGRYSPQINGGEGTVIDNPVTKIDFAQKELLAWLGEKLRSKINKQLEASVTAQRNAAAEQVSALANLVTITIG